jgi:hypothetical protein
MLDKLDPLATKILEEALEEDTSLDSRLEALKLLGNFYKLRGGDDTGDSNVLSMDDLKKRVAGAGAQ